MASQKTSHTFSGSMYEKSTLSLSLLQARINPSLGRGQPCGSSFSTCFYHQRLLSLVSAFLGLLVFCLSISSSVVLYCASHRPPHSCLIGSSKKGFYEYNFKIINAKNYV